MCIFSWKNIGLLNEFWFKFNFGLWKCYGKEETHEPITFKNLNKILFYATKSQLINSNFAFKQILCHKVFLYFYVSH